LHFKNATQITLFLISNDIFKPSTNYEDFLATKRNEDMHMKLTDYRAWAELQVKAQEERFEQKYRAYMAAGGDLTQAGIDAWFKAGCPVAAAEVAS
jgi:hypothetical protein